MWTHILGNIVNVTVDSNAGFVLVLMIIFDILILFPVNNFSQYFLLFPSDLCLFTFHTGFLTLLLAASVKLYS